jgi:hypothetical protein
VAAGETATPEPGRNLRIGDPVPSTPTGNAAARGVAPGVSVGNPEPAANGSTSQLAPVPASGPAVSPISAPTPPPPATGSAANIRTLDEAQQFLRQNRVNWQRLENVDGNEWKFECSVPNPGNPQMSKHYSTTRAFPDPLSAIREVIMKMEQEPR